MKHVLSFLIFFSASYYGFGQSHSSSQPSPREHSNVIKEYDENGNITRYDSTYTRVWTSSDSISSFDLNKVQETFFNMMQSFNQNVLPSGFSDSVSSRLNQFDFDSFSENMQEEFKHLFSNDSVIYTYPLDSTMMEPLNQFFSPQNMKDMQDEMQRRLEEMHKLFLEN